MCLHRMEFAWDTFFAGPLMAKNRNALTRRFTIPRVEPSGDLMFARLRENCFNNFGFFFEKVVHLVDSAT